MPKNQLYRQAIKRKVDAALAMDKEFEMEWIAEFLPDAALAFVKKAEADYNRLTRKGIVGLVKYINDNAPTLELGPDNVNTGQSRHRFRIGNEASRVVYVIFDTWATDPSTNWKKLVKGIEKYAKEEATCDQFTVNEHPGKRIITIRIWWD